MPPSREEIPSIYISFFKWGKEQPLPTAGVIFADVFTEQKEVYLPMKLPLQVLLQLLAQYLM